MLLHENDKFITKKSLFFFHSFLFPLSFLSPRPPLPRLLFTIGSSLAGHFNQRRGHPKLALPPTCSSQPRIGVPQRRDRAKPPSNPTANLSFHRRSDHLTADPAFLELEPTWWCSWLPSLRLIGAVAGRLPARARTSCS